MEPSAACVNFRGALRVRRVSACALSMGELISDAEFVICSPDDTPASPHRSLLHFTAPNPSAVTKKAVLTFPSVERNASTTPSHPISVRLQDAEKLLSPMVYARFMARKRRPHPIKTCL